MQHFHCASDGSHLQVFLDAVLDIAGDEGFYKLQEAYGGTEIYASTNPKKDNWLSNLLGWDKAKRIGDRLKHFDADGKPIGNYRAVVPLGFRGLMARTVSQADQLLMEGQTATYIARQLGIHERTVRRRKARLIADGKLKKRRR